MARKSNKTAHVLNLLSGQESTDEAEKETQAQDSKDAAAAAPAPNPAPAPSMAGEPVPAAQPEVPAHISIIDNGPAESDPVAEQIRDELLKSLEPEETAPAPASEPEEPKEEILELDEPEEEEILELDEPEEEEIVELDPTVSEAPEELKTAGDPETLQEPQKEPEISPSPQAEPEPDYVMVNVMQRIVEDKIIYYMKQFEVCTCPRCKADTIALTLTGLPSRYMVMDKFAVDPMISYMTSRLISQVTVEALKACTQVKENPRH